MKLNPPVVDYRKLRLNNLLAPEFRHVLLLIYWPMYLLTFIILEPLPVSYTIYSPLDDLIPFCEWFVIPYLGWMVALLFMSLYTLAYDIPAFKRFMYNLILTTIIAETCYIIWPNQQLLRVDLASLGRANPLTWVVNIIYTVDSNTNVCPSLHCIDAFAILFAALDIPRFRKPKWVVFFVIFALMICASTVFIKQHSILDFFAALPVVAFGWLTVYLPALLKARKKA